MPRIGRSPKLLHRRARVLGSVVVLVAALLTCSEPAPGPGPLGVGRVAVAPVMPSARELAAFGLAIDSVRVELTRPGDPPGTAGATTVFFPPADSVLSIDLRVPLRAPVETLSVTVELRGAGLALFRGAGAVELREGEGDVVEIPVTTYVGPGVGVDAIVVSPPDPFVPLNGSLRFQVAAESAGIAIPLVYVAWSTRDPVGVPIDAQGVLRAPGARGFAQVTARAPSGASGTTRAEFVPPPTQIVVIGGSAQTAPVGTPLPLPLEVEVRGADGLGVGGVDVTFQATTGGGAVASPVVRSNAQGRAQTLATLGSGTGPQTYVASAPGLSAATFTITAVGGVTRFAVSAPTAVTAGTPIDVVVTAQDVAGNTVTSYAGTVRFTSTDVQAVLPPDYAFAPGDNGTHTFVGGVSLGTAGSRAVTVTDVVTTSATGSVTFTVNPAAATSLVVTTQPGNTAAGAAISPSVVVEARDPFGNREGGFAGTVTMGIGNNPGGATLGGTPAVPASGGLATFTNLTLNRTGNGYTLVATAPGLASALSAGFNVAPGPPFDLAFTVQPTNTAVGSPITPAVRVTARDALGNVATTFTGNVTVAIGTNPGGAALSGTPTVAASAGVAVFPDLALSSVGTAYTLTAAAAGLPGAATNPFDITLAAGVSWTNATGGLWSNPANWSTGAVPGAADNVQITLAGTYTVTLDVDPTIGSLALGGASGTQTLSAGTHTLTLTSGGAINANGRLTFTAGAVAGSGTLVNQGVGTLQSSTVDVALDNQGLLTLRGGTLLNGPVTTAAGSTLRVEGDATFSGAFVTVANGFTNNGIIDLTAVNGAGNTARLTVTNGSLVNAPGAQLNVLAGTGGARDLFAQLDNQGTLTVAQALTINKTSAQHLNSGTLSVGGGDLTLTQSGTSPGFATSGTVDVAAGRTFSVTGGALTYSTGILGGQGTLTLSGATVTLTPTLSNATLALALTNTTVNGPGTLTNAAGRTLVATGGNIVAPLVNQGLLTLRGSAAVSGPVTTAAGSTLRVEGDAVFSGAFVTVANGFTNNGTLELTAVNGAGNTARLTVTSGSLVTAPGAQINVLPGTGGARELFAQLDNQGTLTVGQPLTINKASAQHLNSGTLSVAGADLTLTQSGTTPGLATSGTVDIAAGRKLSVTGGAFSYTAGVLGGQGTLVLNNVTLNLTPNVSNAALALAPTNTTVNGPGTLTNAAGRTLVVTGGNIAAPLVNQGLLTVRGSAAVTGPPLTSAAGSILRIEGDASFSGAFVTVTNGFTNGGTLELTAVNGAGNTARLTVTNGTLVNPPGAEIRALPGTGGARDLFAQLDNRGTMTVAHPLATNKASAQHQNTGLLNVTGGNLTLTQSGTTPSFTNGVGGVIDVGAAQTLKVTGGGVLHAAGAVLQGRGTVDVAGSSLTVAGEVRPGTSPGVLTVVGTYPVQSTAVTHIELGGLVAGAEYDRLSVSGTAALAGRLDVSLFGGFTPRTGDVFLIVAAGARTGNFAVGSLPPGAQVTYTTTGVEVRF